MSLYHYCAFTPDSDGMRYFNGCMEIEGLINSHDLYHHCVKSIAEENQAAEAAMVLVSLNLLTT